ncbi:helix-turn-helix and ligand-binding sensor domain-containing protein [Marinilabilia rubra]|uniref:Regulator n=1 Tax=Marinilabilia rubra TaxID=2162893 RepID=A0A2U2BAS2_9BACT|nr:triple tyrosine motif-containing protein [Marinilabilia rubra]PWE00159.1 regulator [Marinilabilia rubra]
MNRYFLLFLFGILGILAVKANPVEYGISEIEYFNRRQYGGATQNWNVSQAENGLLYFANNNGVIEYDGSRWRSFPMHPSLENDLVRSVYAENERIFIGATDEFGYYKTDSTGNFYYFSLREQFEVADYGEYWNIFKLNDRYIFQSHNALCIYTPEESVKVIEPVSRISEAFIVNGMVLVQDDVEGLMELRNDALYKVPGGDVFIDKTIGAILSISNEKMVIGTMDYGLYLWDMNGIEKWDVSANSFLQDANIFCGTTIGDDLALGTIQSGVVIIDSNGDIKMVANKDKGLNNNTVLDIFVDQQRNIWAALDNGIARVNYNSAVSFIEGYFDIGTGYQMTRMDDQFYFGTNQALYTISEEDFSSPTKNRDDFKMIKGSNGQVWSIYQDEQTGEMLLGHNLGVFHVENQVARLITPSTIRGAWLFRKIPGSEDAMLVGTYSGLLLLKRGQDGQWNFEKMVDEFSESSRFMEWDKNGDLWVAHGLIGLMKLRFNSSYSGIENIQRNEEFWGLDDFSGFSLSKIDDRLVFTSPEGIYTLEGDNRNTFVRDTLEYFFLNGNYPTHLHQDQYDNIWFFTDDGVGVLRYQEDGTFKKIDNPLVPLKHKLVNGFESVFVLNEETAFFGIEDGFGQYSVTNDVNYYQPFDVHIRGFRSQNKPGLLFFRSSEDPDQDFTPVFKYKANAFEVFYSATWFGSGEVEYSTLLEGFDSGWSSWGPIQNRQFTRLPEGEYTFKVRARNVHGVQTKTAEVSFEVLPPWHRTTLAKVSYFLLALLLFALVLWITHRIAEKSRQREKIREREKYREKEEVLKREALENEKEMIRLRNEKLRNNMKHKEKELANSTMHIIHKNEFLIKVKEELQKVRKADDPKVVEKKVGTVIRQIDRDIDNDAHWEIFETHLEQVHEEFLKRLTDQHKDLSAREMRLAAYLRMNMSSKEIASLMNITPRAVENNRYKLRKKLGLEQGDNLVDYIMKI